MQHLFKVNRFDGDGSNAVGTLVETVGDFIPGLDFSQTVTSKVNQSIDFKNQLETAIKTAVATP